MDTTLTARDQTLHEEIANAISHGLGCLLALGSLPVLVHVALRHGGSAAFGAGVFSMSMIVLYFASTIYHALPAGTWKALFQRLDHAAIFLFIAGSYTPFLLGPLARGWGGWMLAAVWSVAALGMVAKVNGWLARQLLSVAVYCALGWFGLAAVVPMAAKLAPGALTLLLAGGMAYTVGAVFFVLDHRVKYAHFVWHLFVLAGSTCHFFAALWHAPVSA